MRKEELVSAIIATIVFMAGVFLGAGLESNTITNRASQEALEKCEETLPRNQHCKIIAVPENQTEANAEVEQPAPKGGL